MSRRFPVLWPATTTKENQPKKQAEPKNLDGSPTDDVPLIMIEFFPSLNFAHVHIPFELEYRALAKALTFRNMSGQ